MSLVDCPKQVSFSLSFSSPHFAKGMVHLSLSGTFGFPTHISSVQVLASMRGEWECSRDKDPTLSIQACLNIETLFDRVAGSRGMQYSWILFRGAPCYTWILTVWFEKAFVILPIHFFFCPLSLLREWYFKYSLSVTCYLTSTLLNLLTSVSCPLQVIRVVHLKTEILIFLSGKVFHSTWWQPHYFLIWLLCCKHDKLLILEIKLEREHSFIIVKPPLKK